MALRSTARLLAEHMNAKFHSRLYGYYRVVGHLNECKAQASESLDATGENQYVTELKIAQLQPFPGHVVSPVHPGTIQWHSFKVTHPTVVQQFMELTDCVLCGCCTASCPSYWWNNDVFYGPAAMVQAWRFLWDQHNDKATFERKIKELTNGPLSVEFCHNIANCALVCPKSINVDRVMRGFALLAALN